MQLSIYGALTGNIQSTTPSGNNYDKLVLQRIIGAAKATGIFIASGGSVVQTSDFAALLDLIAQNPNTNSNDKKNWEAVRDIINLSSAITQNYNFDKSQWEWNSGTDSFKKKDYIAYISNVSKYLSALASNVDYGAVKGPTTTVVAQMALQGTGINPNDIDRVISLALPSTRWNGPPGYPTPYLAEESHNYSMGGQIYRTPEAPIYNHPLGTFALLKTPVVKTKFTDYKDDGFCHEDYEPNDPYAVSYKGPVEFSFYLDEDLRFYFNPECNLNLDKTKIQARFILSHTNFTGTIAQSSNLLKNEGNRLVSPYVDIDDLRELFMSITIDGDTCNHPEYMFPAFKGIELQFYVETESLEEGLDGMPIRTQQIFTVPVSKDYSNYSSFPHQTIDIATPDTSLIINSPTFYTSDQIIYVDGPIYIDADISTSPGVKLTLVSSQFIEVKPGTTVSPDIELKIGSPFSQIHPQTQVNPEFLQTFCNKTNPEVVYVADESAANKRTSEYNTIPSEENLGLNNYLLYPNPASDHVFIKGIISEKIKKIICRDALGRVVYEWDDYDLYLDISPLQPGFYFIQLRLKTGELSKTKKLSIAR